MKVLIRKSVTVITPTVGSPKLKDAIQSVLDQSYGNIKHLIVVDGNEHVTKTIENMPYLHHDRGQMIVLPWNTGANGYNGQRIYASVPHLVNSDYILFLDEDNWYAPNHVETLVETIEKNNLDWAYSLRSIYSPEKQYIIDDNCESLGKWPIFFTHDNPQYLIDTSSFAFTRDFITHTCHLWHSGPWGEDRRYYHAVKDLAKYDTTGQHTLCYRLGGNPNSVTADFFVQGNEIQLKHYEGKLQWLKSQ